MIFLSKIGEPVSVFMPALADGFYCHTDLELASARLDKCQFFQVPIEILLWYSPGGGTLEKISIGMLVILFWV